MLKRLKKIGLLIAGGVLFSASLTAQATNKWIDFEYIKYSDAWLTCENAAGLDNLKIGKLSIGEAFFNKGNGKFINYYQSNNNYSYGVSTESFFRLNEKIVFYGTVDYSKFEGKNMGGSMLIAPSNSPFDIVEYADSTAGKKQKETYHLAGALSTHLWHDILLGLKADYQTISYFKTRDLRHTNDLMDLNVTTGIRYNFRKIADVGINYYYHKTTEGIEFQSKGNKEQEFNSLISFGSFMGRQERFVNEGYTGSNKIRPLVNKISGVSFQLDILPQNDLHFFNEIGIKWGNGYYGKKSTTTIMFTKHESNILQYNGLFSLKKASALHQLHINVEQEQLTNYENDYKKETPPGGNTTVVYYAQNKVLDRTVQKASLAYTGNLRINDDTPIWIVNAGVYFSQRDQTATFYPVYRKQTVNQIQAETSIKRNLIHLHHMYSFSLGITYGTGSGTEKKDGVYASGTSKAVTIDRYLYREYEYLTTARASGNIGFRYTKALPQKCRIYGDIKYNYTKAFSTTYIGDTFGQLGLSIGCIF